MRELIDKVSGETRKAEDDQEVQDLVGSGKYQLASGSDYHVQLPNGDVQLFNAADATELIYGRGTYLSPTKAQKVSDYREWGERPIASAAAGVFDYGTMGLGPTALGMLSSDAKESFKKLESHNSEYYHGAGITSSIVAALASGGSSLMAQGVGAAARAKTATAGYKALRKTINPATATEAAAKAGIKPRVYTAAEAKAALSAEEATAAANAAGDLMRARQSSVAERILLGKLAPGQVQTNKSLTGRLGNAALQLNAPAIMNRAGAAAGQVASDFITKHGTHKIVPGLGKSFAEAAPIAAKLTSGTTRLVADGVVQGGLYGAGEGLSEVALGDIENASEHILSTMGLNAMYGAAGGAGFGLGIPFIGKATTGIMKATGGLYEYFAKSAASKAMTNSLARISHVMNKDLRDGDLEELMLLYRLDDVGKLARNDMMTLAKRIDDLGGRMTDSAQETFFVQEILQQADKNGVKFETIQNLMKDSKIPAIQVLKAFKEVLRTTVANAEDMVSGSRSNKEELELFLREWADAKTLDNIYGIDVGGYTGQQKRGAAVVRKYAASEGEEVRRGLSRVLTGSGLNGFFDRMVDWLHVGNVQGQEAKIAAKGVITDQERGLLDNFNRFINKNIEFYEASPHLTSSEKSDLVAALRKAQNSGDLSETRAIIEKLKTANRHQFTGSSRTFSGKLDPSKEYLDPNEAASRASRQPVDPKQVEIPKKTQERIDKIESLVAAKNKNLISLEEEATRLQYELDAFKKQGPSSAVSNQVYNRQLNEKADDLKRELDSVQKVQEEIIGLKRDLGKLKPSKTKLATEADGPTFVDGRETLESMQAHLSAKVGPVRSMVKDPKTGKSKEIITRYKGNFQDPDVNVIPEHRNLLDKKMANYSDYEMDVHFPEITLTPSEYETLKIVDKAIKEGKTFLDEVGLAPSRTVNQWEALPKLTQRQIGLRNYPGAGLKKSPSKAGEMTGEDYLDSLPGPSRADKPTLEELKANNPQIVKLENELLELDDTLFDLERQLPKTMQASDRRGKLVQDQINGIKDSVARKNKEIETLLEVDRKIATDALFKKKPKKDLSKVDIYSEQGNKAIEDSVKAARLKLNTMPETLPRSEAFNHIQQLREKGDIDGIMALLNEGKVKGLNSTQLQSVIWDEIQRINNFFHEGAMGGALTDSAATGVKKLTNEYKKFLKNPEVFGHRMAAYKTALSDEQLNYSTLNQQFRELFGLSVGTREYIDPDKITDWITGLKQRTAVNDIRKIQQHAELGTSLLARILRDFDIDNMDFKFSGIVQDVLKDMGISKSGQPGIWKMGRRTLNSRQVLEQLSSRLSNSAAKSLDDLDFVNNKARDAIRWGAATSNSANVRGLIRPSSFMGYFGGVTTGLAMNVVESIQDPRLGIARLHALETLAEQGRKELDTNLDSYINYLATGRKAVARIPRSAIGPAISKRDADSAKREEQKRQRYRMSEDQYDEVKDFLVTLASSNSQMSAFTEAATSPLADAAPETRQTMRRLLKQKIMYMHKMLPNAARGNLFDSPPRPSTMQMAKYSRILEAVNDPVGAMTFALTEGTLTKEVIDAIEETSPVIFSDVRVRLIEKLSDQEFSSQIGRQDKMMLAGMFNIPVVNMQVGRRLRENLKAGEKPGPEGAPKGMDSTNVNSPMDLISARP